MVVKGHCCQCIEALVHHISKITHIDKSVTVLRFSQNAMDFNVILFET